MKMLFLVLFTQLTFVMSAWNRVAVDMGGSGCLSSDSYIVADDDIYTLYAEYKFNTVPTTDHCDVSLRVKETNRRLRYLIEKLTFMDCGIELLIYDNPDYMNIPSKTLKCQNNNDGPITATTSFGVAKFTLRKQTPSAAAFTFQIQVTTDYGPPFDFEKSASEFYNMPLESGAIAGIAIAGAVLVVAVTGIAVFLCLRYRNKNLQYVEETESKPESSVFVSEAPQVVYTDSIRKSKSAPPSEGDFNRTVSSVKKNSLYSKPDHENYPEEKKSHRQNSYPRREKLYEPQDNDAYDEKYARKSGTHFSRHDDAYDEKDARKSGTHFSRHDDAYDEKDARKSGTHFSRHDDAYDEKDARKSGTHFSRHDDAYDEKDARKSGTHISRRDSGKRKSYARSEEYEMSKDVETGTHRSRSHRSHPRPEPPPPYSSTHSSPQLDHRTSVHRQSRSNPQIAPVSDHSRSRSRAQSPGSLRSSRSGSTLRRSSSQGRSSTRGRTGGNDRTPKTARQYNNMSHFIDNKPKGSRPR